MNSMFDIQAFYKVRIILEEKEMIKESLKQDLQLGN